MLSPQARIKQRRKVMYFITYEGAIFDKKQKKVVDVFQAKNLGSKILRD